MLQHERTSLAWERTAIATMVAGVILARQAALLHPGFAAFGMLQVLMGSAVLIWTGQHYDDLHGPLRDGLSPVHPAGAQLIGAMTTAFCAIALLVAIALALT